MIQLINTNQQLEDPSAEDVHKKHLIPHKEINKDIEDYISGVIPQGFKSTSTTLNEYFLFKKNEFYLCTGRKGEGKTSINIVLQCLGAICNDLIFVVAFQENSEWSMKLNYMNYILGDLAKNVRKTNPELFNRASAWMDKHFYFIDVESVKEACDFTEDLIKKGVDVHALFLDPINSFMNGWQDTGNAYADGKILGIKILNFSKKHCSVHVSQHPTMSAQRSSEDVTSYDGEGGWLLNKASFTWYLNQKEDNENELVIDNVRNKHTGGDTTKKDNPLVIKWYPDKIDIYMKVNYSKDLDAIGDAIKLYNPLKAELKEFKDEKKELPTISVSDAFGEEEIPF